MTLKIIFIFGCFMFLEFHYVLFSALTLLKAVKLCLIVFLLQCIMLGNSCLFILEKLNY